MENIRPRNYLIQLSEVEKQKLNQIINKREHSAREIKRAHALLHSDKRLSDEQIILHMSFCKQTVHRIRNRYSQGGLDLNIYDKPRSGAPPALSGKSKALLTSIACSKPPKDYEKWSLDLLKDRLVELSVVENISKTTIGKVLKKRVKTLAKEELVYWPDYK